MARVGYAELSGNGYVVHHEHARGAAPLVGSVSGISLGAILREDLRRGETVAVCDVQTDPRLGDPEREAFRSRQIAALVSAALCKGGRMVAAFGANNTTPRDWTAAEITLIRDVAERTWDAVERARVETAILEQEQRLRLALEASAGGSWTWVAATNEVDWDERLRALYGFSPDEPAGYPTVCKGRYQVQGEVFHALEEPTSLNTLELLPRLRRAGVVALKIEGRQRGQAYVTAVTRVWRQALDRLERSPDDWRADAAWLRELARHAEGRQTTLGPYHRSWH